VDSDINITNNDIGITCSDINITNRGDRDLGLTLTRQTIARKLSAFG
jgi:hypothetical protein